MEETFLDRLRKEQEELSTKIEKLKAFLDTEKFYENIDEIQQTLLRIQYSAMLTYHLCLVERLKYIN